LRNLTIEPFPQIPTPPFSRVASATSRLPAWGVVFQIHTGLIRRWSLRHGISLAWGKPRRGGATGAVVITTLIMIAAAGISGAVIYHNLGTAASSAGIDSPPDGGQPAVVSDSTSANFTAAVVGQVAVTVAGAALPAGGFNANSTTTTFTCSASPSGAHLTLTNGGTGSASVSYVSVTSGGVVSEFTPSGACEVGGLGSGAATTYVIFPANSQVAPSPVAGQDYTGVVGLSDGASVPFNGVWQ